MLAKSKILTIIREKDLPVEETRAGDVVMAHWLPQYGALLQVANPNGYMFGIGKRATLKFYDIEKLKQDGVYIHKRNYGGSGAMFGPSDIIWSLHVMKNHFSDGYDVVAADAYKFFNVAVFDTFRDLGMEVEIDESVRSQAEDGACIHLQGRSEIITPAGRKVAVSVYKEDDIGIYINGAFLISDAWARIYEYLASPVKVDPPGNSVERILARENITQEVEDMFVRQVKARFFGAQFRPKTLVQREAIKAIEKNYRIE